MALLIDGYNLLHASGILPQGLGPATLERSRQALLNFLANSLPAQELPRTTVVFDAREAPRGLAREVKHAGITVKFAAPDGDADRLIEELIRRDSAPRRLTVVSSDHRLQRAARRRGATAVDSDVWFVAALRARAARGHQALGAAAAAPPQRLTPAEVAYWMSEFYGRESSGASPAADARPHRAPGEDEKPTDVANEERIFPPGYGEDLLDE
ncbi:MAG: NYN domain-containing protein [Pirellulales bacterium]|nr:NYN domain-containing protein [Pirellulales bacterium]